MCIISVFVFSSFKYPKRFYQMENLEDEEERNFDFVRTKKEKKLFFFNAFNSLMILKIH